MTYKTEQESFWAGDFGNEYIKRNTGEMFTASTMFLFGKMLRSAPQLKSIIEFGCNIGLNLKALKSINKDFDLCGYEINMNAAQKARDLNIANIINDTIVKEMPTDRKYDLAFTRAVLIHVNPNELDAVYNNLYNVSNRYVLVCEYYNPTPVTIEYRGNKEKLFKRDFAGELIDRYNMRLVDYGFTYHRDNYFPQDDASWFLLEK